MHVSPGGPTLQRQASSPLSPAPKLSRIVNTPSPATISLQKQIIASFAAARRAPLPVEGIEHLTLTDDERSLLSFADRVYERLSTYIAYRNPTVEERRRLKMPRLTDMEQADHDQQLITKMKSERHNMVRIVEFLRNRVQLPTYKGQLLDPITIKKLAQGIKDNYQLCHADLDGSCFYHSGSILLFGGQLGWRAIRAATAFIMLDNEDYFRTIMNANLMAVSFAEQLRHLFYQAKWANEVTITATMVALDRPIFIYESFSRFLHADAEEITANLQLRLPGYRTHAIYSSPRIRQDLTPLTIMRDHERSHFMPLARRSEQSVIFVPTRPIFSDRLQW